MSSRRQSMIVFAVFMTLFACGVICGIVCRMIQQQHEQERLEQEAEQRLLAWERDEERARAFAERRLRKLHAGMAAEVEAGVMCN